MPITGFLLTDQFYNVPGLGYLNFVEEDGVDAIAADVASVVSDNITLKSGYAWKRGEFVHEVAELTGKIMKSAAGDCYDVTVTGFYPKVQPLMTHQFWQMKDRRFLVSVKDQNRYKRLLGNVYGGAEFGFSESSGMLGGMKVGGYDVWFNWKTTRPPLFYLPDAEDAVLIPEDVEYVPGVIGGGTGASFYYYNTSDPAIAPAIADAKKLKISVLAGKTLLQFTTRLGGQGLTQNDPDVGDNKVTAITGDGTITFKNNVPVNSELLIFVK